MAKAFWLESMARRLAMAEASFPDTRARISPGTAMAASTPMMAQATSSSMRLNPDSLRALLAIVVSWQQSNRGPAAWFDQLNRDVEEAHLVRKAQVVDVAV